MQGTIFDIKEFTVHDGPGARVTVFLKGCPLRCKWCHNPEGLKKEKQLMYKKSLCVHCGKCLKECGHDICKAYGRCIYVCVNGCLTVAGEELSGDVLAERLAEYKELLRSLEGGITFSGGEPMMQADFVCETTDKLTEIHKAVQTSGYTDLHTYQKVVNRFDFIMQDIKLADNNLHMKYTGVSNERILENIAWLKRSGKEFVFRVPLIPGITDTEENLRAVSEIVGTHKTELMPYNPVAGAKYQMIGMEYTLKEEKNRTEDFTKYFQNAIVLR